MSVESPLRSGTDRPLSLIETLRFDPAHGCIRADLHLARMAASAQHFGKKFDLDTATRELHNIKSDTQLRVRLYLDEQDMLTLTANPFVPIRSGQSWTVAIARTKLDAANSVLMHKTSLRQTYDEARAEFDTANVNEVILKNQHGHVCEGAITSVFVQKGDILVTPPLHDGLLRGVLRQELLETGKAVEGTVTPQHLETLPFFVGNSLRGLIPAKLYPNES
jgi:4-amino-4-deoxychorismate lyase